MTFYTLLHLQDVFNTESMLVRVEIEISQECGVCLRQGNALSLVLFILLVNLISFDVWRNIK